MPGRNFLATQTHRQSIQRGKLQTAVARNARNGGFAVEVTRNKRLHYIVFELAFEVQNVKRKAQLLCYSAGVVNVIERTAARWKRVTVFVHTDAAALIPQLHREADEFVPLVFQNCCRSRRIHATAHCYCYLHHCSVSRFKCKVSSHGNVARPSRPC